MCTSVQSILGILGNTETNKETTLGASLCVHVSLCVCVCVAWALHSKVVPSLEVLKMDREGYPKKMSEQKDPRLTSSHGYTKITPTAE